MGNLKILKRISVLTIIFTMLSGYIFPIMQTKAAENDKNYINLEAAWEDETTDIVVQPGETRNISFKIKLDSTQFKNMKMYVLDTTNYRVDTSISISKANVKTITNNYVEFNNMSGGKVVEGFVRVKFYNDSFSDISKELSIRLTGEYYNTEKKANETIDITKTVKATVGHTTKTVVFDASVKLTAGSVGKSEELLYDGMKTVGYKINNFTQTYYLDLSAGDYLKSGKLDIIVKRTARNGVELTESNHTVNFGELKTAFGEPTVTKDTATGGYKYTFNISGPEIFDMKTINKINKKAVAITVQYKIDNPSSEGSTNYSMNVNFSATGYDGKVMSQTESNIKEKTINVSDSNSNYLPLYLHTPGSTTWIEAKYYTGNGNIKEVIQGLANGKDMLLPFYTSIRYTRGTNDTDDDAEFKYNSMVIGYYKNGVLREKTLNNSEAVLKSVKGYMSSENAKMTVKKGNNTILKVLTPNDDTYESLEGNNDSTYIVKLDNFSNNYYGSWNSTYKISGEKLLESGMTVEEIKSIAYIETRLENISSSSLVSGGMSASYNIPIQKVTPKKSYMEFSLEEKTDERNILMTEYNQKKTMNMKISMYKNTKVFTEEIANNIVKNENPQIYIQLPKDVRYLVNDITISGSNADCLSIKEWRMQKFDNRWYLIIDCAGTYTSDLGRIDIQIEGYKILTNLNPSSGQQVIAYLVTDNKNYINSTYMTVGDVSGEAYDCVEHFSIEKIAGININSGIKRENSTAKYMPTKEGVVSTKNNPVKCEANSVVTLESNVKVVGSYTMKNISLISRLPIAGNKFIKNSGNIGSDISLAELKNIKVLKNGKEISEGFTLKYSTDSNANYDSTFSDTFTSDAKTILLECDENIKLNANDELVLKYEMKMPTKDENLNNVAGSVCAVKYTLGESTEFNVLESAAAYIKEGNSKGKLTINKKFEFCGKGETPLEASYEGIEFKLLNMDTDEYLNLNGTDVFKTDANGKIVLENISEGIYLVEELTEFKYYRGINGTIVDIVAGDKKEIDFENKLKTGNIIIQKEWKNTEKNNVVEFTAKRADGKGTTVRRKTDGKTGIAVFEGLPYGAYIISETSGVLGWFTEDINVDLFEEYVTVTATNEPGVGTLVLHKTVPVGDTVDGLKFKVTGYGDVEYTDLSGEQITTDTDMTVVIDKNIKQENVEIVEINEDRTSAVIKIKNLPVGVYLIEEIEMPTLDNGDSRYKTVNEVAKLKSNNEEVDVYISNKWKTGTLKIVKYARLGKTSIPDLSIFSVRITGTSEYGTKVDKIIKLDENGLAELELEIGSYTITENHIDGYEEYYISYNENKEEIRSKDPVRVQITSDAEITQELLNLHTGVGYVKVIKTLETVEDAQKVVDKGIKFRVLGTNPAGDRVEQDIVINTVEENSEGNKIAVGYSKGIPVGGEYELEEVEETIPQYYEGAPSVSIQLTTANTLEKPLVMNFDNPRGRGDLEIKTVTVPEGGPLAPITYTVTEVELNNNLTTYVRKEETKQVLKGSNGYAELKDVYAGTYLVEQTEIPKGYVKDVPQIVEVPNNNTGYATFEITKTVEMVNNKAIFEKEILNNKGEIASEQDLNNAKLNADENFEMKIVNVEDRSKVYYTFFGVNNTGVIKGLEAGTYEIDEVYKPKYLTQNYYMKNEENEYELLEKVEGKYVFTIEDLDEGSQVSIKVQNKINTEFGFGGQDSRDNFSKVEPEQVKTVTKSIIYITDEEGNALPGASFVLKDSNGKIVKLPFENNTYITNSNKKLQINGLKTGIYTLECTNVPQGYLIPSNKEIIVYSDATLVARVEIQKDIDRGTILLSTFYNDDKTQTAKYVSSSSYQIVNSATNELVGFAKTPSGDYVRSNLPTALTTIKIKAGVVELRGVETGDYDVGIVAVKDGYGIVKDDAEYIAVEKNKSTSVSVETVQQRIVDVAFGDCSTMFVDAAGKVKIAGTSRYCENGYSSDNYTIAVREVELPNSVKIVKIANGKGVLAIDSTGKVWAWGSELTSKLGLGISEGMAVPTCVTDLNGTDLNNAYKQGIKIIDAKIRDFSAILLDSNGKIWTSGKGSECGNNNEGSMYFVCISDIEGNPLNGIKVNKIYSSCYDEKLAIDEQGQTWVFESGTVKCISDDVSDPLYGINAKKVWCSYSTVFALDMNGIIWKNGTPYPGQWKDVAGRFAIDNEGKLYDIYDSEPKQILENNNLDNFNNGILVSIDTNCNYDTCVGIDRNGALWGYGYNSWGQLGTKHSYIVTKIPVTYNKNLEFGIKFEKVAYGGETTLAIDKKGQLWGCGNGMYTGLAAYDSLFQKIEIPGIEKIIDCDVSSNCSALIDGNYDLYKVNSNYVWEKIPNQSKKFKSVKCIDYAMIALATDGTVWTMGTNTYYGSALLGIGDSSYSPNELVQIQGLDNIVKIEIAYNSVLALDTQGLVYYWGYNSYVLSDTMNRPTSLLSHQEYNSDFTEKIYSKGAVITDIAARQVANAIILLDSTGMAWIINNKTMKPITEQFSSLQTENTLKYNFETKPDYEILKINALEGGYAVLDNYGDWWFIGSDIYDSSLYIGCVKKLNRDGIIYERTGKYIENISYMCTRGRSCIIIDGDNNVVAAVGTLGQVGFQSTGTVNQLYNVKISELTDSGVKTADGRLLDFSGNSKKDYIDEFADKNNITIKQRCIGSHLKGGIFRIVLDTNGKVWTQGNNTNGQLGNGTAVNSNNFVCISDIKGTELNNAYTEHPDFKIEKICVASGWDNRLNTVIALDNYGKIWSWGDAVQGLLGNGESYTYKENKVTIDNYKYNYKVLTPVCISNISGNAFYNEYSQNSEFRIVDIEKITTPDERLGKINENYVCAIKAKDNNNRIWVWGFNGYGTSSVFGNGTTKFYIDTPYCINGTGTVLAGKEIDKIEIICGKHSNGSGCKNLGIVLTTDGELYFSGEKLYIATAQSNRFYKLPITEKILDFKVRNSDYSGYNTVIYVQGENNLYRKGYESHIDNFNNIEIIIPNAKIKQLGERFAIDNNNKLWSIAKDTGIGIKCLSDTQENIKNVTFERIFEFEYNYNKGFYIFKDSNGNMWKVNSSGELYRAREDTNVYQCTKSIFGSVTEKNIETMYTSIGGTIKYNNILWRISNSRDSFTISKLNNISEIISANIVDVSGYYALDSEGNLYTKTTGQFVENGNVVTRTEVICLTKTEKIKSSIVNGRWSVVNKQF